MRVLARVLQLRVRGRQEIGWIAAAAGIAVSIEVFGHGSRSELIDAAGVVALVLFIGITCSWHRYRPLSVARLAQRTRVRLGAAFERFIKSFGIDLRGTPELRTKLPPWLLRTCLALLASAGLLLALGHQLPHGLRDTLADTLYVGNVLFLGVLWTLLGLGTFVMLVFLFFSIHDELVLRPRLPRRWRMEITCLSLALAALVTCGVALPAWTPIPLVLAATAASLLWLLPLVSRLTMLWRSRGPDRTVYSTSIGSVNTLLMIIIGLAATVLTLLAQGLGSGSPPEHTSMPFTTTFGLVFGWSAAAGLLTLQLHGTAQILREYRHDPDRPCPPVLHISGSTTPALRSYLRQGLSHHRWEARFEGDSLRETDVRVVLDTSPQKEAPSGPRRLSIMELEDPTVLRELDDQDRRGKRRILRRGLHGLLGRAFRRRFKKGTGFWVNPHHWFAGGLTRDTDEDEIELTEGSALNTYIGPPYRLALPRPVRHHLAEVLRTLEVDLLFLQDGVSFQGFWAVMTRLFKRFDDHGTRLEDSHITGIPGVSVLIHDYVLEEPLIRHEGYTEPDYEDVGRARILHVFQDHGGDDDPVEIPRRSIPRPVSLLSV